MFVEGLVAAALLAGSATARTCLNLTIPVTISSRNGVFNKIKTPLDNLDATQFQLNSTQQGINGTAVALSGYATVSGTYNISAQYCRPTASNTTIRVNSSTPALQILTHGIGFDKTYWDLSYNGFNYSYVNTALDSGYHTFAYDRLGIGNSSHGEPKNEIQAFLEVAALAELTRQLRNGRVSGITTRYTRVIHVGHSFGSGQSYALSAMYPRLSDGLVLTGFSTNMSFLSLFNAGSNFQQAYLNQPLRFGNASAINGFSNLTQMFPVLTDLLAPIDVTTIKPLNYPPGYLTNANAGSTNYLFLRNGNFDPLILGVAERSKQPVTVGEALTISSVPKTTPFTGPVLIFTGSNDLPFCGGDCLATGNKTLGAPGSIPAKASIAFPRAKTFSAYIQPNTGHGLNLHYNATAGYRRVQAWLSANGLGA